MLKTRDRHREIYHKERERVDGGKRERAQKCLESKKKERKRVSEFFGVSALVGIPRCNWGRSSCT
jgi:hypothetical protein